MSNSEDLKELVKKQAEEIKMLTLKVSESHKDKLFLEADRDGWKEQYEQLREIERARTAKEDFSKASDFVEKEDRPTEVIVGQEYPYAKMWAPARRAKDLFITLRKAIHAYDSDRNTKGVIVFETAAGEVCDAYYDPIDAEADERP